MDERSPLDNRSLSHTSREPEGQAWAQIGTKAPSTISKPAPVPLSTAKLTVSSANAGHPPVEKKSSPPSPTAARAEEDALSDDGRPLQVVEDAESEPPQPANNDTALAEEKKNGGEEEAAGSVSGADAADNSGEGGSGGAGGENGSRLSDRTNSSDPKMVRCRVFVGHLNTDKCSRNELEELFTPFGKVASVSLQHGYGFVQYYDEQAAKRAITELHGLQFKGMKLVVDKTAALKRIQGENPNAPKPWTTRNDRNLPEIDLRRREAAIYEREYAMYERSARLDEFERMYYDRYPTPVAYGRDPYYDRYYDRPMRDPYMERYRQYPDMERGRYYDRPAMGVSPPHSFERAAYYEGRSSYERPRDDLYERRDDGFRDHQLRDREPFERFDSSRRL
jgi:RNA recognition motif-containing protein